MSKPEGLEQWAWDEAREVHSDFARSSVSDNLGVLIARALQSAHARGVEEGKAEQQQPLTAPDLADALDCFWNAAIGTAQEQREGHAVASIMAVGLGAVSERLRNPAIRQQPQGESRD